MCGMFETVLAMQGDEPREAIVFIPEGDHLITPMVNGVAKEVSVRLGPADGEDVAQRLQGDLDRRLEGNVRPIFDFDHNAAGPAAALPKRFFYEPGAGVMCEVEWTGAGQKAIAERDYSYFSPVFLLGEDGMPAGLPERGALGALVNDPAFREIPRIAAADASGSVRELVVCGLLSEAEAAQDDASSLARERVVCMRDGAKKVEALSAQVCALEKELETARAEARDAKLEQAEQVIRAAVADGRIAPRDEETKGFYRGLIVEKGEAAVKALDAMPRSNSSLFERQVKAGAERVHGAGTLEAEARKLVEAGEAADLDEAVALVEARSPELYEVYRESLVE